MSMFPKSIGNTTPKVTRSTHHKIPEAEWAILGGKDEKGKATSNYSTAFVDAVRFRTSNVESQRENLLNQAS